MSDVTPPPHSPEGPDALGPAVRDALDRPELWEEPSADLEDRVVAELTGEVAEPPPGPTVAEVAAPGATMRRWAWLGAAAVILLAAIGIGTILDDDPDWTVAIEGTDAAPGAMATVDGWNTEAGTVMRISAEGLPPSPDGFFYEMWLSDGPLHISGGTFTQVDDVELLVGVARADFPRIWITLEPIDEDESPSRTTVLDTPGFFDA